MFKRKERRGLRSPRVTKRLLRWAIRKKSRLAYASVLAWPKVLTLVLALFAIFKIPPGTIAPWLYHSKTILFAILSVMYVVDAALPAFRSWRRRYAPRLPITPSSAQDGS